MIIYKTFNRLVSLVFISIFICDIALADVVPAKVVVHINNPLKMTMLVNNVGNLRKALGKETKIVVVVNGPAVARFTKLSQSRKQLDRLLELNSEIAVCAFSLRSKNFIEDNLYPGTIYLENGGVAKLVELQQLGYAYIKP